MWARFRAWFTDNHREMMLRHARPRWGAESLLAARSIIGWGEVGANNRGPQITELRRGKKLRPWQTGEWCAVAMSWCLEEAWAVTKGYSCWRNLPESYRKQCPVKRTRGAMSLGNRIAAAGCIVSSRDVAPGDFAIYSRRGGGHIAIVCDVHDAGYTTIDGNKGRFNKRTGQGSKVRKFRHEWGEPNLRFFARLPQ